MTNVEYELNAWLDFLKHCKEHGITLEGDYSGHIAELVIKFYHEHPKVTLKVKE